MPFFHLRGHIVGGFGTLPLKESSGTNVSFVSKLSWQKFSWQTFLVSFRHRSIMPLADRALSAKFVSENTTIRDFLVFVGTLYTKRGYQGTNLAYGWNYGFRFNDDMILGHRHSCRHLVYIQTAQTYSRLHVHNVVGTYEHLISFDTRITTFLLEDS